MQPFFDINAQYQARKVEINAAVQHVLNQGVFIMGPEVKLLEQALAEYTNVQHCISCANGTDALQLALMSIGLKPGDEVITTPFTFVATAEVIVLLGAKPVFVDIEQDSFLINHRLIEEKITTKTRAILPVSLYGQIPEMDEINEIASAYSKKLGHKIFVIEDAAQSFGASYKGKKSGSVCDIATTSFFPTKPLGCFGDGGAIFTDDDEIAQSLQEIRIHGQSKRYYHTRIGVNSRLDTLQAAILLIKLKYVDEDLRARQKNARDYNSFYKKTNVCTPIVLPNREHAFAQYTVKVNDRDSFRISLQDKGIPTVVHYQTPLHKQPAFLDDSICPVAEKICQQVVSLPMCIVHKNPSLNDLKLAYETACATQ